MSMPLVCVIGADSSGTAAAKVLHQRGIPFDYFEKGDLVGGNIYDLGKERRRGRSRSAARSFARPGPSPNAAARRGTGLDA